MSIQFASPNAIPAVSRIATPLGGTYGLVVDDGAYGPKLASALQRWGAADVAVSRSDVDALRLLRNRMIDWVLLEHTLEGTPTGLAVAAWLRERQQSSLRILHTAAAVTEVQAQIALDQSDIFRKQVPLIHTVVPKPSSMKHLVSVITAYLERGSSLSYAGAVWPDPLRARSA
jgi:DNA-binding response OmpR family regulator